MMALGWMELVIIALIGLLIVGIVGAVVVAALVSRGPENRS